MRYRNKVHPGEDAMKRRLLDILACPICKYHPLELDAAVENEEGVVEGKLTCPHCKIDYPITEGIPDLIPPDMK